MLINAEQRGSVLFFALEGRLDTLNAVDMEKTLQDIPKEVTSLVLDFSKVDYVSSAGLRELLGAHKRMSAQGGMKLTNINERVMEVFSMTGFSEIFTIE